MPTPLDYYHTPPPPPRRPLFTWSRLAWMGPGIGVGVPGLLLLGGWLTRFVDPLTGIFCGMIAVFGGGSLLVIAAVGGWLSTRARRVGPTKAQLAALDAVRTEQAKSLDVAAERAGRAARLADKRGR